MSDPKLHCGGVSGYYLIEAVKANGESRVLADWFPNLITNAGLDMLSTGGFMSCCQVGSGTTEPNVLDTALASRVAGTTSASTVTRTATTSAPYYTSYTRTYTFAEGVAAGNLSEVGISATVNGELFSRARILDGIGNPTTITVLGDEILRVTYQLRHYRPVTDQTGTVTIGGVTHDYVSRASDITSATELNSYGFSSDHSAHSARVYSGGIDAVTGSPSGTSATIGDPVSGEYTPGSHVRGVSASASIDQGNVAGGIRSATFGSGAGSFQVEYDPPIAKDNTKVMTLNWQLSWGRYTE